MPFTGIGVKTWKKPGTIFCRRWATARRRAEILARAEALAERRRIMRNRRCEEAGFTALLGAETGQADLEEALSAPCGRPPETITAPSPGGF